MKKTTLFISFLLLLTMSINKLYAQNKPYNEEITVIAAFDPIIPDAFKINVNPVVNDTTTMTPVVNYSILPKDAHVQLEIEQLPSVKLVAEPLSKLYRNYLKVGAGNYSTIYGELFASSLRSKTHLLGLHFKHYSADGNIKNYSPAGSSSQLAELYGQKYFENHTLSGNLHFNREGLHLYGFKPDDVNPALVDKDNLKQRYMSAGADVSFDSRYKTDNKLNHSFRLGYDYLADKFEVRENQVRIGADLSKKFDLFKWENMQTLGLTTNLTINNQKDSIQKINASILNITPSLAASFKEYSFKVGLGFYVGMDTVTNAHLYPMLEGKIDLIPGSLQLYAGIDGGMERNVVSQLIKTNPYISSGIPLDYTYNKFRAYGGFTSNISRTFNFNGSISSTTFENYPFFITDTNAILRNSFTLAYDDVTMLKIRGELEFVRADQLRIGLGAGYYSYNLSDQEYAWYKPDYDLNLNVTYSMQDKIILKLQTTFNGPVWALAPVQSSSDNPQVESGSSLEASKIKGWVDVSLGAEYKLKKALSFWLNLNNLTGTQHQYWYNYPSYRFNALAGLSYSF
ncbi:MAG: hypothetical protein IPH88_15510 [Bacteroidales bacterium]|nr:hypothetical protein [Bacteroidales bacterium]